MALDFQEAFTLLDEYKNKAINEEYNIYEKSRHTHFGELFDIREEDPILGEIRLDGSSPKVIKSARESLKRLSNCDMYDHKKQILKIGKQIVKRSTPEIKHLFSTLRDDEEALLSFLIVLFKSEAEILQIDESRAKERFGAGVAHRHRVEDSPSKQANSFTETQKMNYIPLEDIVDDYLFSSSECDYEREAFDDHKSQCHKMGKVVNILVDYLYDKNSKATSGDITLDAISEVFDIIPKIPKKQGNTNQAYPYYEYYKKLKDTTYTKRGSSTISTDLLNYNRFIKYLEDKGYISAEELKISQKQYVNIKKSLSKEVRDGDMEEQADTQPLKGEMLKCLFSADNNPYKQLIDVFLKKRRLRKDQDIEDYWIRYFIPLILLFTGARGVELARIKVSDCELREFEDGVERVILYIQRKVKTKTSRRIILIHDFLANDLGFIKFIKKAQDENKEYLFNETGDASKLAGKEFNRSIIKKKCIEPFIDREDVFYKSRYVMYSLRNNYKTHMVFNRYDPELIRKIQGHKEEKVSTTYLSTNSEQIVEFVNNFTLHEIIDWTEFKKVAQTI